MRNNLWGELTSEFIGTALLIFLGDGVVATAVLYGAYQGQWQPSILWGLSVALCVYVVGAVSGAHFNPAVTIALGLFRKFPTGKILPYIAAQVVGGFAGAALLHGIIAPVLHAKGFNAETARIFSTYPGAGFPNFNAFLMEAVLTMFLVLVILAIGDARAAGAPKAGMGAIVVGLAVALLVGIGGPWTMAALNPARDLGPRLWMAIAGWGSIAIPGPNNYFWVPILGPIVGGGILAGLVYDGLVGRFIPSVDEAKREAA
jgi:glycerol uptake facilitator protein